VAETLKIIVNAQDRATGVLNKIGSVARTAIGFAFGTIAVKGLQAAGRAVSGFVQDAMAVEGTQRTFANLVDSIGGDVPQAMEQLRDATRGMVADDDLMAAANKFVAMGLAENTEEAAKLSEMATQLGMAMGEDATASMENFALMLANQSILRLDSFGISSGKVRERIEELTGATETYGMTQPQIDAAIADSTEHMKELEDALYLARLQQSEFTDNTKLSTRERQRMKIADLESQYADENARLEELNNTQAVAADSAAAMTREQAFMTAVMEEGAVTMEKVGEQSGTVQASWNKLRATGHNLALTVGGEILELVAPAFSVLAEKVMELAPKIKETIQGAAQWIKDFWPAVQEAYSDEGLVGVAKLIATEIREALAARLAMGDEAGWSDIGRQILQRIADSLVIAMGLEGGAGNVWMVIGRHVLTQIGQGILGASAKLVDVSAVFADWAASKNTQVWLRDTGAIIVSTLVDEIRAFIGDSSLGDSIILTLADNLAQAAINFRYGFTAIGVALGSAIWEGLGGAEVSAEQMAEMTDMISRALDTANRARYALFAQQAPGLIPEFPATPGGLAGLEQSMTANYNNEITVGPIYAPGSDATAVEEAARTGAMTALQAARAQGWQ